MKQLRKRFNEEQVKELLKKYEDSTIKSEIIYDILGIASTQFFRLLKQYRQNELSLSYKLTSTKLLYSKLFIFKKTSFLYDLTDVLTDTE